MTSAAKNAADEWDAAIPKPNMSRESWIAWHVKMDQRQAENIRRRAVWRSLNNTSGPKEDPRPGDEAWLRSEWRERR